MTASAATISPDARRSRGRATVGFAAAAMFVSYLPFSATNGALHAIGSTTASDTGALQWVTDAFTIALTAAVLSAGAVAARIGRRRATTVGLALTVLGSLLAAGSVLLPATVLVLQAALAVAGIGGGVVMGASLALIAATAPDDASRSRSIAVWAAANVAALGAGPFLPALMQAAGLGWSAQYLPVAALTLLVLGASAWAREVPGSATARFDPPGQALGIGGLTAIVVGVVDAGPGGWLGAGTLVPIAVGLGLLAGFVAVERRAAAPVLPLALFRFPGFDVAGVAAAIGLFTIIGAVFALSVTLGGLGATPLQIATCLLALFAGNVVGSLVAGRTQPRLASGAVLAGSLALLMIGLALIAGGGTGVADLAWRLVILGLGGGGAVAISTTIAIRAVPAPLATAAGTGNTALRQFGGALGAAVTGTVLGAVGLHGALIVLAAIAAVTAVAAAAYARRARG